MEHKQPLASSRWVTDDAMSAHDLPIVDRSASSTQGVILPMLHGLAIVSHVIICSVIAGTELVITALCAPFWNISNRMKQIKAWILGSFFKEEVVAVSARAAR